MNIRKLDLRLIRSLDALVAERNVTRAASRVHMSQPAMSSALKRLREIFDDQLLTRNQRGMVPTQRGVELAQSARSVLDGIQAMSEGARPFDPATSKRTFHLAMTDYTEFVLLPSLIRRLQSVAPGVNIAVVPVRTRGHIDELLADAEVDLATCNHRAVPDRIQVEELFYERFVCLVGKGNSKVGKRLTLENFSRLPHVFISPRGGGFYGATDEALAVLKRSRRIAVSVPHFLVAPFIVANSDLIMVMTERVARYFVRVLPLKIFKPPLRIEGFSVSQIWHARSDHDSGLSWLRGVMSEVGA